MRSSLWFLFIVIPLSVIYAKEPISIDNGYSQEIEKKLTVDDCPEGYACLVEQLIPAVVNISTEQVVKEENNSMRLPKLPNGSLFEEFREFFEKMEPFLEANPHTNREVISLGSGFIVDEEGIIVTNYHVITNAKEIMVTLSDNTQVKAKILGKDPKTDLAVLKIDVDKKLPFVKFGDSDKARVGSFVIAIGNPFGLGGSVSTGIVSAIARNINIGTVSDFIQTDAAINKGNSGGPLFNKNGEVIGINTAIFSPSGGSVGVGFAVPSNIAKPVIKLLKEGKEVEHGWIGVKVQAVTKEAADSLGLKEIQGALVAEVTKDGPADKAGIKVGDVITEFNGVKISKMAQLPQAVSRIEVDKKVNIKLYRKGEAANIVIKIGKLQDDGKSEDSAQDEGEHSHIGLIVSNLSRELKKENNINNDIEGVIVLKVDSKSDAFTKGIRRGEIITHINQNKIRNVDEFKKLITQAKKEGQESVLLRCQSNNLFISIKLG